VTTTTDSGTQTGRSAAADATPDDRPVSADGAAQTAGWPEVAKPGAGLPPRAVHADATQLPDQAATTAEADAEPGPYVPPDNRATAQPPSDEVAALAAMPRILDAFAAEVRRRGHVGEERNAQILYLVLTSRLLDKLVSAGVKGHSASGKSATVEQVLQFFPDHAYIPMTAMSERALVYNQEPFSHRTLVMFEVVALREGVEDDMTSYFIRSLLSEGCLIYDVTVRDPDGGFTTKTIRKEGPTNLIFTTTKTHVHAENETRVLSLNTDDSAEQTARVFAELANEGRCDTDPTDWRELQEWLEDHGERRVTIPYAAQLAKLIPPVAVRLRRDFGALLALIRTHAFLHQATRDRDEDGRVIASVDDYAVVRELVGSVITEGVGATVPDTVRETVAAVATLAGAEGVMAVAVAEELKLDKSNVSRRLRVASEGGYVVNLEDRRGKPGRWIVGEKLPDEVDLLPDPELLFRPESDGGCAVAVVPEGVERDADPAGRDDGGCAVAVVPEGVERAAEVADEVPVEQPEPQRVPPPAVRTATASAEADAELEVSVPSWLNEALPGMTVVDAPVVVKPYDLWDDPDAGPCADCHQRMPNRYGAHSVGTLCETCRAALMSEALK
jgi:hypothetical protein